MIDSKLKSAILWWLLASVCCSAITIRVIWMAIKHIQSYLGQPLTFGLLGWLLFDVSLMGFSFGLTGAAWIVTWSNFHRANQKQFPLIVKVGKRSVTDEQILSETGAWMLCCAVGAYNKTLSTTGTLDFDTWFLCCRDTWVKRVAQSLGVSTDRIESVVRSYAKANAHLSYEDVFEIEKDLHPDKNFPTQSSGSEV